MCLILEQTQLAQLIQLLLFKPHLMLLKVLTELVRGAQFFLSIFQLHQAVFTKLAAWAWGIGMSCYIPWFGGGIIIWSCGIELIRSPLVIMPCTVPRTISCIWSGVMAAAIAVMRLVSTS